MALENLGCHKVDEPKPTQRVPRVGREDVKRASLDGHRGAPARRTACRLAHRVVRWLLIVQEGDVERVQVDRVECERHVAPSRRRLREGGDDDAIGCEHARCRQVRQ